MNVIIMRGHFKKSASILTDQETQMVGNDSDRPLFATLVAILVVTISRHFSLQKQLLTDVLQTYFEEHLSTAASVIESLAGVQACNFIEK